MRIIIVLVALLQSVAMHAADETSGEMALRALMAGNDRFVSERSTHPNRAAERRLETVEAQEPKAIILGCSDSRVSPEILFDQGVGDLFVVRVAGNVVAPVELDSIEYAALYLHAPLLLVVGHENCGAIKAVMQGQTKDIEAVADLLKPAIQPGATLEDAIKSNVLFVVSQLKKSPPLQKLIQERKLLIRGGYYHFLTGKVELL